MMDKGSRKGDTKEVDLRDVIKMKAMKHRSFYRTWETPTYQRNSILNIESESRNPSTNPIKKLEISEIETKHKSVLVDDKMMTAAASQIITMEPSSVPSLSSKSPAHESDNIDLEGKGRQRKTGAYSFAEQHNHDENEMGGGTGFPGVDKLIETFAKMIGDHKTETVAIKTEGEKKAEKSSAKTNICQSPVSDEGCGTPLSAYNSSDEEEIQLRAREKVARSSSSDSALGLEEEVAVQQEYKKNGTKRRMTLTVADIPLRPALYPLADPNRLPSCDSPTNYNSPTELGPVRSTMILAEQIIPVNDELQSVNLDGSLSRRESSISTHSDGELVTTNRLRYMRTPSVVVSVYGDELVNGVCGLSKEEIEYFQQHRLQRRSSFEDGSDVSASSSCSNLNFCGSHISLLDDIGLRTPERKISSCSTCTNLSCDEDDDAFNEKLKEALLQQQQQQKKKVSFP